MKTKEAIKQAENFSVAHVYSDGTALYDLSVNGKAYSDHYEYRYRFLKNIIDSAEKKAK